MAFWGILVLVLNVLPTLAGGSRDTGELGRLTEQHVAEPVPSAGVGCSRI